MSHHGKELLREQIVSRVLIAHRISRSDLVGKCRDADLVAARKAIAHSLRAAGFGLRHIGRILHRDRSTIEHYLGARVRVCMMLPNTLNKFPDDVRDAIAAIALAERTTPAVIITEWVTERARMQIAQQGEMQRENAYS
jgi:hypothetical protein